MSLSRWDSNLYKDHEIIIIKKILFNEFIKLIGNLEYFKFYPVALLGVYFFKYTPIALTS